MCSRVLWSICTNVSDEPSAVFVVGPARLLTQHDCHHDTKVKPEAASAVIELLMMGGKRLKHVEL
jgi:hypothetical protein